jgi:UDP-N-acetylglucosamine 2-epimerase (non-hydrolysing)
MLQSVLNFFEITPDYDLSLMQHNQTLFDITANILKGIEKVLEDYSPDLVLVQGDTTTAMAACLSAFYKKIKVGHVEAGLRSGDIYSPFPEEVNRKIIGNISNYHFAPTDLAKRNLANENIHQNVFVTGNTVIDALLWGVEKVRNKAGMEEQFNFLTANKRLILVTAHRRESFGAPFENICNAVLDIANDPDVEVIYPVHLNPNVQEIVYKKLGNRQNIHLIKPLDYPPLLWIMDKSYFVITDSGGIQEEAPSLGKPVLVIRDVTERIEGIEAGTALLVGTKREDIVKAGQLLLNDQMIYQQMAKAVNPYGDGKSAQQIVSILLNER